MHVAIESSVSVMRRRAFEDEALPWVTDVHRFAQSLTRDPHDADDVVQDTFLRAYRSWHTFVPGSDCRRWLFTICRNVFLRSRERRTPVDAGAADGDPSVIGELQLRRAFEQVDDTIARIDLRPAIERALARVPEPFRSALRLVDVDDHPYERAADILGVPVGTVRSRLFRGRRLMQQHLRVHASDAGYGPGAH